MSDFVIENGVLTYYTGADEHVVVPEGVTEIGARAFFCRNKILSVVIPDSVTHIRFAAFAGCSSLTSIAIPDSVTVIGNDAFEGCTAAMITLPASFDLTEKRDSCFGKNISFDAHTLVRMMMYQTGKEWKEAIPTLSTDLAALPVALNDLLGPKKKIAKALGESLIRWILAHKKELTVESVNPLYQFLLTRHPDSAAALAHDKVLAAMLDTNNGGDEIFIMENGVLTGINGSGKSIALPGKPAIAPDALQKAQYEKILIPAGNTGHTMEWFSTAKISSKVKELNIDAGALLFMLDSPSPYLPFSASVQKVLKVSGKIPTDPASCTRLFMWQMCCMGANMNAAAEKYCPRFDMADWNNALSHLIPPFPADDITTADDLVKLTADPEAIAYLTHLCKVFFGNAKPDNIAAAGNTGMVPAKTVLWLLVELARCNAVEGGVKSVLPLIDQVALSEFVWRAYKVDTHSPSTPDISPIIRMMGHIGTEKQISRMLSDLRTIESRAGWLSSDAKASRSRVGYAIQESIALNDNYEVLLMLDKRGELKRSAIARGISVDEMRQMLLNKADTLLDQQGKHRLDYGPRGFVVTLQPDMTLSIWDEAKAKQVKSLPKPGKDDDAAKASQAAETLKQLKSTVKNIAAIRTKDVQSLLYEGRPIEYTRWKSLFLGAVIPRTLASGILWGVYGKDDSLLQPFSLTSAGSFCDDNGTEITLKETDLIGVVDAAQLTPEALDAWRTLFWGKGVKAVVRQFEAPGRYVAPELAKSRYEGLTVSTGYAMNALGGESVDSSRVASIDGSFITVNLFTTWGDDLLKITDICLVQNIPAFDQMTDHQKRLWNRDIIRLDSILHPEKRVREIVISGDVEQVKSFVDTHLITPDNITDMLGLAIKHKRTEATAYLMQCKQDWIGEVQDPFAEFTLDF